MRVLDPAKLAHIGFVVEDLEGAVESLEKCGHRFLPISKTRVAQSLDHVQLEIIEERPGTHWRAPEPGQIHHLAYWTDDLKGEAENLVQEGFPVVATDPDWSYHV